MFHGIQASPDQTPPGFRANALLSFFSSNLQDIDGSRARWGAIYPENASTRAQDSWQLLMLEGKICSLRRAFTRWMTSTGQYQLLGELQQVAALQGEKQPRT
jgi:hypothetical protein